ncbi:radical SAM domain-containing protein [Nakamurella antarctica]|uniref:Radical SAM domain-containing protein n=1 Tax=Nakamurella antarctica TaxID=1902245 RepID=A0A3G8ZM67_9ACTN|nr:radical SAM domain-containing protein [Nakamurella antarctica]AZI58363.1 radical SAM domain-containing protein [Nakamurella antarctica]
MTIRSSLAGFELATRPVHPGTKAALARRWAELPAGARTKSQTLGQHAVGCEGTHGVFPKCNLACTPCYHSRDANQVAVDGDHTRTAVAEQMALLQQIRGPRAHAQLIGGEVTLLPPDDHAATLRTMRDAGREPMSMTHGDFDYDYLEAVALGSDGKRRLDRMSFAGHFDMFMFGRRGIARPADEAALTPYRQKFVDMFQRLETDHGVRHFLAHNMTVTPRNLDQIAGVVQTCHAMGFGLFSFQPAAFVGDDRRWHDGYRAISDDDVWAEIERGAGTRLPFKPLQNGDERCNRTAYGFYVGPQWFSILDENIPADLRLRDAFMSYLGGVNFSGTPAPLLIVKVLRSVARHPSLVTKFGGWLIRKARDVRSDVGLKMILTNKIRPVTFVMHSFMDAKDVAPAWAAMQRGEQLTDPTLRATQERLQACSYAMAHPETGELVPACVQHGVLDPGENVALRALLPLAPVTSNRIKHA